MAGRGAAGICAGARNVPAAKLIALRDRKQPSEMKKSYLCPVVRTLFFFISSVADTTHRVRPGFPMRPVYAKFGLTKFNYAIKRIR